MKITEKNIFDEARKINLEALRSDLVDKVKYNYGWTPLHELASRGVKEILTHPSVDKIKDNWGETPLHILVRRGVKDVLNYPSVSKFKDKYNSILLRGLAFHLIRDIINHPSVDQVKDIFGNTPLYWLVHKGHFTEENLRKKYPWYKKEIKNIHIAITEIVNTPKSIQFILED